MTLKICPEGLIEGPHSLHSVVNPDLKNPNIFFEHTDLLAYCTTTCSKTDECTSKHKLRILNIFNQSQKTAL